MRTIFAASLLVLFGTGLGASCGGQPPVGAGGSAGVGGGGNTLPELCKLPPETGPCLASMLAYYHDAKSGVCIPFTYGGCGGNANRFATQAACQAACNGGTPDLDRCRQPYECTVAARGCCGDCGDGTAESFVGLNRANLSAYVKARGCTGVACGPCPPIEVTARTTPYFAATCEAGSCQVVDTRRTSVTECTTDSDCTLRMGMNCCESCGGDNLAAVNKRADLNALLCGEGFGACPPCVPVYPEGFGAICNSGRCAVARIAP
ncbi:MAG TPA: BPTI/Kunitz domain-containing protein [Polyangiaceae bacterium]|nr:BPTI/Kunitz domain-containing protein [Polyangiaceae bacterium]